MDTNTQPDAVPVKRMTRVLVKTAATLGRSDARYLVNAYYAMQRQRESAEAQLRRASDSRPHEVIAWVIEQDRIVEKQIKRALDEWSDTISAARWAKSIIGVGCRWRRKTGPFWRGGNRPGCGLRFGLQQA
jgi:hypothetical protein